MAAKEDVEKGHLQGLFGLITAEVFSDILEMAEHLLKEKYKDPAAIVIGTALEFHLKNLCRSNDIDTVYTDDKGNSRYKKASVLISDLSKACKTEMRSRMVK